jgi:hypothetical protein
LRARFHVPSIEEHQMALIARYDTPARLRDVPEESPFYDNWHGYVNGAVSLPSGPTWIDPVLVDVDVVTGRTLSWIGFPRRTLTVPQRDDRAQAFAVAAGPPVGTTP